MVAVWTERTSPFFQTRLVLLAMLLMLMDGYDTQAVGYVAPVLTLAWHADRSAFGAIFSAGLLGLTLGALVLAPVADRTGCRRVVIGCTLSYGVLTILTPLASSVHNLILLRFLTGLGLGGAMPSAVALVSDYAAPKLRNLLVALAICGFSLGGAVGGLVAAVAISRFGWQSVFIFGGVTPLLSLPFLVRWLPESAHRFPSLKGTAHQAGTTLTESSGKAQSAAVRALKFLLRLSRPRVYLLFSRRYLVPTLLIWTTFFCNLLLLYFLANWIPTMVRGSGLSLAIANVTAATYQIGGTVGALSLALLCDRTGQPQRVLGIAFVGAAIFCYAVGVAGVSVILLLACAAGAGFCVVGGQIAANAFVCNYYPSAVRATGIGWALGIGRFGSILGPLFGAVLLRLNVSNAIFFGSLAGPACLAALCVFWVRQSPEPRDATNETFGTEMLID